MALEVGSRLGHYDVTALIGEGGMGQVYQATDTKLKRQVALKILPEAFSADPERLARFQREAEVLASLNHPNIAAIHGLEESEGIRALVLELVEGPTLADRIKRGPIPLDEALPIAKQIAEALEAAHEAGVIHRDLKPANIKVREDGTVKVLDFGLAKALDPSPTGDPSQSPTLTAAATQMGVIMGTEAYMSPEQAKGRVADKRADIWSFGVVLFEMLTGKRAFGGETVSETLADVMKSDPKWDVLSPDLPSKLANVIHRCLEKDPHRRVRDIGDVRLAMEGVFETTFSSASEPLAWSRLRSWQKPVPVAIAAVVLVVLASLAGWTLKPDQAETRRSVRFPHVLAEGDRFRRVGRPLVAVSPDGTRVVYVANGQLYLRILDELRARPIQGTDEDPTTPFFSSDGESIGFWSSVDSQLKKISIAGGTPVTLCDATNPFGASWGTDNTIVFGQPTGVMRVSANGGISELVVETETGEQVYGPELLPDGRTLLFTVTAGSSPTRWDEAEIVVRPIEGGERKVLWTGGSDACYVSTGHLVYAVESTLLAIPFDLAELETRGGPVPVVEDVFRAQFPQANTASANYGFSRDGLLAYIPDLETFRPVRSLVWVDREGKEEPLAAEPRPYESLKLSPDNQSVLLDVRELENNDIWIYDLVRGTPSRLTFDPGIDRYPIWTPDGERVVFASNRDADVVNMYWKAANGIGPVERLTTSTSVQLPHSFAPDGRLVFGNDAQDPNVDLYVLSMDGERQTEVLVQTEFRDANADVSPDGRWLAYVSDESGQSNVYVRPFPNVDDGRWQISRNGGYKPVWGPDSQELFYQTQGLSGGPVTMIVAANDTDPTFSPGNPVPLFEGPYLLAQPARHRVFDVSANGQRFLMIKEGTDTSSGQQQVVVVLNWFEELTRLVPTE